MYIDKEVINEAEITIAGDILKNAWDCVSDTGGNWWFASQMYLKGVHDMAEALRRKYHDE